MRDGISIDALHQQRACTGDDGLRTASTTQSVARLDYCTAARCRRWTISRQGRDARDEIGWASVAMMLKADWLMRWIRHQDSNQRRSVCDRNTCLLLAPYFSPSSAFHPFRFDKRVVSCTKSTSTMSATTVSGGAIW